MTDLEKIHATQMANTRLTTIMFEEHQEKKEIHKPLEKRAQVRRGNLQKSKPNDCTSI